MLHVPDGYWVFGGLMWMAAPKSAECARKAFGSLYQCWLWSVEFVALGLTARGRWLVRGGWKWGCDGEMCRSLFDGVLYAARLTLQYRRQSSPNRRGDALGLSEHVAGYEPASTKRGAVRTVFVTGRANGKWRGSLTSLSRLTPSMARVWWVSMQTA